MLETIFSEHGIVGKEGKLLLATAFATHPAFIQIVGCALRPHLQQLHHCHAPEAARWHTAGV